MAEEILTMESRGMCVKKSAHPVGACMTCLNQCIDLSFIQFDCSDVEYCECAHLVDRVAEYGVPATLTQYTDQY